MRAFVTGINGFCGAHLVHRLRQERGITIAGLDSGVPPSEIGIDHYFRVDVTNPEDVAAAVKEFSPDLLFHLAGVRENSIPASRLYEVNISGAIHILEAVRRLGLRCRALLAGSAAEYGPVPTRGLPIVEDTPCRPVGSYAISKYAASQIAMDYARRNKVRVSVVRPFNIVGPGVPESLVVGALLARAKQAIASAGHAVVKIGDLDSRRDFVAVNDAVDAYVRLAKLGATGEIFNICSGRAYSIRQVAKMLLANSPSTIALEVDPQLVSISPARVVYGSYRKAARAIGFRPSTPLKTALKLAWDDAIKPEDVKDLKLNTASK